MNGLFMAKPLIVVGRESKEDTNKQ